MADEVLLYKLKMNERASSKGIYVFLAAVFVWNAVCRFDHLSLFA